MTSHELRRHLLKLGLDVWGDDTSWAAFSPCGRYRYALGRGDLCPLLSARCMVFVLHNPSTADHSSDDPTLRKCLAFARREGCDRVILVNRFAFRSTDKARLLGLPDAVGPLNSAVVPLAFSAGDLLVFAWGLVDHRIDYVPAWQFGFLPRQCLGINGDGSPKHPLYLPNDTALVGWP